jgi:hypothetical protein
VPAGSATGVARERLELDRDVPLWIRRSLAGPRMNLVPLLPQIAVAAVRLGGDFPGDPGTGSSTAPRSTSAGVSPRATTGSASTTRS